MTDAEKIIDNCDQIIRAQNHARSCSRCRESFIERSVTLAEAFKIAVRTLREYDFFCVKDEEFNDVPLAHSALAEIAKLIGDEK